MPETLTYAILSAAESAFAEAQARTDEHTTPDQQRQVFLAYLVDNVRLIHPALWGPIAKEWS